ncbi:MAG: hypothetical protein GX132_03960 [Erysipelotrichia bacterium]|nr:hypothetical protein [Erysipelotrichia bacterium]
MKNKKIFGLIIMSVFLLSSCMQDVSELYKNHAYDTGDFMQDYYSEWHEDLKTKVDEGSKKTFDVNADNGQGFVINNQLDFVNGLFPDDRIISDEEEYQLVYDTPHDHAGIGYGPSNNLISIDSSFARGFLSRLYDGRLSCDGRTFAQTRVQIDKNGYGALFPKELMSYHYFALALRGGEMSHNYGFSVNINLVLTFYIFNADVGKYMPIEFLMKNFPIVTNSGGNTTLIGFYFSLITGGQIDLLKRVSAMSITFSLNSHLDDYELDRTVEASEGKTHFSLMLYEVLLPKSTWH